MFTISHICLIAGWGLYGAIHSLLAAVTVKQRIMDRLGKYARYYRLGYALIAVITLVLLLAYHFSIKSALLWSVSLLQQIIASLLLAAGIVIMAVCSRKYFAWMMGIDIFLNRPTPHGLEQTGLHRYMRHPLYSGTFLFIWSLFLLYPSFSNLLTCICVTIYTLIGIELEERKLLIEFGDAYKQYAAKVFKIIPGVF